MWGASKARADDTVFASQDMGTGMLSLDQLHVAIVELVGRSDIPRTRTQWLKDKFSRKGIVDKSAFRNISSYLQRGHNVRQELADSWLQVQQLEEQNEALRRALSSAELVIASHEASCVSEAAHATGPLAQAVDAARAAAADPMDSAPGWTMKRWLSSLTGIVDVLEHILLSPLPSDLQHCPKAALAFVRSLGAFGGNHFDEADKERLASSRREELLALLQRRDIGPQLISVIDQGAQELAAAEAATGGELHNKFVFNEAFPLSFAPVRSFFLGLDGILGPPAHNMASMIDEEHRKRADSRITFAALNYRFETFSEQEYWFVCSPHDGKACLGIDPFTRYPGEIRADEVDVRTGRVARPLEAFDGALAERNSQLGVKLHRC